MALTTGTRLGPDEITAQIGVGGLGGRWHLTVSGGPCASMASSTLGSC